MSKNQKTYWLSGHHSVEPALYNPRRVFRRLVWTKAFPFPEPSQLEARRRAMAEQCAVPWDTVARLPPPEFVASMPSLGPEPASSRSFESPPGGGGQARRPARDVAGLVEPLPAVPLRALLHHPFLLVLDQVTDVGNFGAILRTAWLRGVGGVITSRAHSPAETSGLARVASGALDLLPVCRVPNLARALRLLREAAFWVHGLEASGTRTWGPRDPTAPAKIALVVGSEDRGLRHQTRVLCDELLALPQRRHACGPDSYNVSVAVAMALTLLGPPQDGQDGEASMTSGASD